MHIVHTLPGTQSHLIVHRACPCVRLTWTKGVTEPNQPWPRCPHGAGIFGYFGSRRLQRLSHGAMVSVFFRLVQQHTVVHSQPGRDSLKFPAVSDLQKVCATGEQQLRSPWLPRALVVDAARSSKPRDSDGRRDWTEIGITTLCNRSVCLTTHPRHFSPPPCLTPTRFQARHQMHVCYATNGLFVIRGVG